MRARVAIKRDLFFLLLGFLIAKFELVSTVVAIITTLAGALFFLGVMVIGLLGYAAIDAAEREADKERRPFPGEYASGESDYDRIRRSAETVKEPRKTRNQ